MHRVPAEWGFQAPCRKSRRMHRRHARAPSHGAQFAPAARVAKMSPSSQSGAKAQRHDFHSHGFPQWRVRLVMHPERQSQGFPESAVVWWSMEARFAASWSSCADVRERGSMSPKVAQAVELQKDDHQRASVHMNRVPRLQKRRKEGTTGSCETLKRDHHSKGW